MTIAILENYIPEPNSGCWLWLRGLDRSGYGGIFFNSKSRGAHRVSWELFNGPVPAGMCVLHRCDVRSCINPDHLFLGTKADNNEDMHLKGRAKNLYGEAHQNSKLSDKMIDDIRARSKLGEDPKKLAMEYGVHYQYICKIRSGRARIGSG
jgi:hypothetical protein